jgi:hypothetical protein
LLGLACPMNPPRPANDAETPPTGENEWLSVTDAAALIARNPETIRRWIRDGRIHARRAAGRPGGAQEVRRHDLIAIDEAPRTDSQSRRPSAERSQVLVPGKQVVLLDDNSDA